VSEFEQKHQEIKMITIKRRGRGGGSKPIKTKPPRG